jgi:SAM-dependent methyltransferase
MLYHVPEPARAVAEIARFLRPGGVAVTATNGPGHLRELWAITTAVLGGPAQSPAVAAFGAVSGAALLGEWFAEVVWRDYPDELRCTDAAAVVAFITSAPPGEDATPDQRAALRRAVADRMAAGDGVLTVAMETGVLLSRGPRPG